MDNRIRRQSAARRWRRTGLILSAAGTVTALLCAGCGSSGSTSANTTATTTTTTATPATTVPKSTAPQSGTGAAPIRAASGCLVAHGVPVARVATAFGRHPTTVPSVSNQTLQAAGIACQATLSPTAATVVKQLDACITSHGATTVDTGSPLADILLLNPSPTNESAVSACITAARN